MSAKRLDQYLADVEDTILARQDANTGLLPASTAITVHGDYTHAWVRDNVYSILAVWALGRAYRRVDQDIADRLDGNVVRLMRGLLAAMMRQANKVERFKVTQNPLDALHAKYDWKKQASGRTVFVPVSRWWVTPSGATCNSTPPRSSSCFSPR